MLATRPLELPITLDYDQAKLTLLKIAEENPTRVDAGGRIYFAADGTPSCLVGQVLAISGIGHKDLTARANCASVFQLAQGFGILRLDSHAELLLSCAQESNDDGMPWGQAAEKSITYVEGLHSRRWPRDSSGA